MTYIPNSSLSVGILLPYCGVVVPKGWLWCYGQAISRDDYGLLFSVIGTTYGTGDGLTTFNVPDFRGRVLLSSGHGSGLSARSEGQKGGEETHILTIPELPIHHHFVKNQSVDTSAQRGFDKALPGIGNTSDTGGDQPHNNMQPFVVIRGMILKYY